MRRGSRRRSVASRGDKTDRDDGAKGEPFRCYRTARRRQTKDERHYGYSHNNDDNGTEEKEVGRGLDTVKVLHRWRVRVRGREREGEGTG